MLKKCEVGHDGKTAHERLVRKGPHLLGGVEFDEAIHWKETPAGGGGDAGQVRHDLEGRSVPGGQRQDGEAHRGHLGRRLEGPTQAFRGKWRKENAEIIKVRPYSEEDRDHEGKRGGKL